MQSRNNMIYAGFFVRFIAYLVDCIIIGILTAVLRIPKFIFSIISPNNILERHIFFQFSLWDIIFYIASVLYFVMLVYLTGTTVGKKLFRLEVVNKDGDRPDFLTLLYRETIGRYLSYISLCIGYIIIGLDVEKRGFHDMLSDTRVIYNMRPNMSNYRRRPMEIPENIIKKDTVINDEQSKINDTMKNEKIKKGFFGRNIEKKEPDNIDEKKVQNINKKEKQRKKGHDFADKVRVDKNVSMRRYQKLKELVISVEQDTIEERDDIEAENSIPTISANQYEQPNNDSIDNLEIKRMKAVSFPVELEKVD